MSAPNRKRAKPPRLQKLEIKALVRFRDGYRCTECGMSARRHVRLTGRNLEVHRIVPGGKYTVKGCVTLCQRCHAPKPRSAPGSGQGAIGFRPPDGMTEVVEGLSRTEHRSHRNMLLVLVMEALEARGRWPLPETTE